MTKQAMFCILTQVQIITGKDLDGLWDGPGSYFRVEFALEEYMHNWELGLTIVESNRDLDYSLRCIGLDLLMHLSP